MKQAIHPTYFPDAKVICACGNTFTTGSTQDSIRVELCSKCHPFFTGQQKFVDTAGQVDKFEKIVKRAVEKQEVKKQIATHRAEKAGNQKTERLSLRDLLLQARKNINS